MFKAKLKSSFARGQVRTIIDSTTAQTAGDPSRLTATSRARCEQILGYRFTDEKLLQEALTISPHLNKRLAIIGDRVFGLFMAEKWYSWSSKSLDRREWAKMYHEAFSNQSLARTGFSMGLHDYTIPHALPPLTAVKRRGIPVGGWKEGCGRPMADTIEALVGSVWLDSKFDRDVMTALLTRMGLVHRMVVFPAMATTMTLHHDFFKGKPPSYLPRFFTGLAPEIQHWSPTAIRLSRRDTRGLFVEHELNRLAWKEAPDTVEGQKPEAPSVPSALRRLLWGGDAAGDAPSSKTKVSGPQPDAQLVPLKTGAPEQTEQEEQEEQEEEEWIVGEEEEEELEELEEEVWEADEEQEKAWPEELELLMQENQKPKSRSKKKGGQKKKQAVPTTKKKLSKKEAKAKLKLQEKLRREAKKERRVERNERRRERKAARKASAAAKVAAGDEQGKQEA